MTSNHLIGQKVSINWRLTDKQKGLFGFDVLPNIGIVKEVKTNCYGETMVYFESDITVPVRIERVEKIFGDR